MSPALQQGDVPRTDVCATRQPVLLGLPRAVPQPGVWDGVGLWVLPFIDHCDAG